jgi:superfamily II DNA or RNA helicase
MIGGDINSTSDMFTDSDEVGSSATDIESTDIDSLDQPVEFSEGTDDLETNTEDMGEDTGEDMSEDMGEDMSELKSKVAESHLEKKMLEDRTFPSPSDKNFQYLIYKKRDFSLHASTERKKMESYEEIKEYRDNICVRTGFKLNEHQSLLANFINPNTPYTGLLVFHGTGSGKTCAAVAIAEKFKPLVEKYGTKIHILTPGPLLKQNFLNEIIKCTGETYLKIFQDKNIILSAEDKIKIKKNATAIVNQYYRIMTYRSFYKKVLGEKIREKVVTDKNVVKSIARKTETGEYERDISMDRIYSLDNTLLIVDEAHALTDSGYGDSVKKIIEASKQLKILLLTATPMKNSADNIVDLLNYLRPIDSQIERDKIFTTARVSEIEFKAGGKEYLRRMCQGYVSYLRGADPLTYAERVDVGEIPPGLDFIKVIRCYMEDFQLKAYQRVIESIADSFDRRSEAVANFVFPGLSKTSKTDIQLEGFYGIEGMNQIKHQLKNHPETLTRKIGSDVLTKFDIKDPSSLLYLTDNAKVLTGDIFGEPYLKYFSIKFYTAIQEINQMVWGKKGPGLLFVYSNLVRSGIDLFREVMSKNDYLEYQEVYNNYVIKPTTRCYFCDYSYARHTTSNIPEDVPKHKFYPATFLSVTGKSEENPEQIPEETIKILDTVFGNIENKDGKFLKMVLGSKVMTEGFNLRNIKEIHILDVHFNLGRIDQVIGRGIRWCVHHAITNESNPFPKVKIYKYVVSIKNGLSSEEELYQKAEQKYILIKETERILQEEAIDCPLNYNSNIFPEELERYKDCGTKNNPCPATCGYMKCQYKCSNKLLNAKYYDPSRNIYRKVEKANLDYSTYDSSLADEEINYAKERIKELYLLDHIYVLADIVSYIKKSYPSDKKDLFDDFYVYRALNDLLPVTSNDFNNFKDTLTDKFNRPGYLIYRNKYYIFNPFNENENLPMYYRNNYAVTAHNKISLNDYIKHTADLSKYKDLVEKDTSGLGSEPVGLEPAENKGIGMRVSTYDFSSVWDYYEYRDEFKYVGIIDKDKGVESSRTEIYPEGPLISDIFKIRNARPKVLAKKRETGIPTFKGAVCQTAKDKKSLLSISNALKIPTKNIGKRITICDTIRDKLYDLEKYSTTADKNKLTYLVVPSNHPTIPFPLNLEDRIKNMISSIQKETKSNITPKIHMDSIQGRFPDIKYVAYRIEYPKDMDKFKDIIIARGGTKAGDKWVIKVA